MSWEKTAELAVLDSARCDLYDQYMNAKVRNIEVDIEQVAELDRRWKAIEEGEETIPHDEVVRWLETWGTPAFRPWRDR